MFWLLALFALATSLSVAAANIMMGLLCPLLLLRLWREPPDWRKVLNMERGVFLWLGLFLLSAFLSTIISPELKNGAVTFINYYIYRLLPAMAVLFWPQDRRRLWSLAALLVLSTFINDIIAIFQAIRAPSLLGERFGGTIGLMAQAGSLSAVVPVLALATVRRSGGVFFPLVPPLLLISVAALLLNGSRGAWLAAFFTTLIVLALAVRDARKFLLGLSLSLLLLGGIFTQVPALEARFSTLAQIGYQSNAERILMWRSAYDMFTDHPLLGVGVGHYTAAYQEQYILPEAKERFQGHAHSNIMQMMAERGSLGLIAFGGMWLYFMWFALHGWWRTHETAYLTFLAIVLGVMLQGLTEYNLGTVVVSKMYWFSLAIALRWIALTRKERTI